MTSTTSRVERTRRDPEEVVANLVQGLVCACVCACVCTKLGPLLAPKCIYKACLYLLYPITKTEAELACIHVMCGMHHHIQCDYAI